jgi:anaerobic selenocysteine-containing dehydrogenase
MRFFNLLGATTMDSWAGVGDLPMGAIQTWGHFNADGTSDDWFNADYLLIWIANPVYTRIPDAHFMWEARYRGATVVSIAPDLNASSIHADLWLNVRMGTDAALGLAMAHVIIEKATGPNTFANKPICHFSSAKIAAAISVTWRRTPRISFADGRGRERNRGSSGSQGHSTQSLPWETVPAGTIHRVAGGQSVQVRPLLQVLAEHLQDYTPERRPRSPG